MSAQIKLWAVIAFVLVAVLLGAGRVVYKKGYDDAVTEWAIKASKAEKELISKKDAERAELEKKLTALYVDDLRNRDERLRQYEEFVRTNGNQNCSVNDQNAIARIAVGFEEVAVKAIRFLEAERSR